MILFYIKSKMIEGLNDRPSRKPPFDIGARSFPSIARIGGDGDIHPDVTKEWRRTDNEKKKIAQDPLCRLRCCTTCTPIGKLQNRDVEAAMNLFLVEGSYSFVVRWLRLSHMP